MARNPKKIRIQTKRARRTRDLRTALRILHEPRLRAFLSFMPSSIPFLKMIPKDKMPGQPYTVPVILKGPF